MSVDVLRDLTAVAGEIRGKVGPVVFSRNTHGPYSYTWQPRTDPNTANQQRIRAALALLSTAWRSFPPSFRQAWATFAASDLRKRGVGRSCHITGFQHYLAALSFRFYTSITGLIWAPQNFTKGRLRQPTYLPFGYTHCTVRFHLPDPWRTQSYAGIAIFASRPQPVTVNHFKGPFQFVKAALGHPVTPPILTVATLTFQPTPTKPIVFFRARVIEGDNRLSPPLIQRVSFP